ncbi:MAG: hypothetical protein QOE70_1046 [Chthoniobacter sp.]|jgi:hypothetical protein|nr:hypothetical protein [Chthoniobacter sp.]
MPIYEFYSPDNHKIYSFYARSLAYAGRTPRCPDGARHRMERIFSSFAITGRAKEKPETPEGGPDDARMEAAMAEMEREFGGMDSENPDPRQLARMMRKMSALSGEKVPGEMEEMMRRMEAGEDPEKLEEEFGDAVEGFDPLGGGGEAEAGAGIKARLRALRRPTRDPVLYEMSEFVD